MIFEVGLLPCGYAWKPVESETRAGIRDSGMFWAISGRVLCVLGFLVARLEQTPGARKDSASELRIFSPKKKDSAPVPVLEADFEDRFHEAFRRFPKTRSLLSLEQPRPDLVPSLSCQLQVPR